MMHKMKKTKSNSTRHFTSHTNSTITSIVPTLIFITSLVERFPFLN